jgi:hypothetical protein
VLTPCRAAIRAVRALPALPAGQATCRGQPPPRHVGTSRKSGQLSIRSRSQSSRVPSLPRATAGPPWPLPRDLVLCPPPRPPSHSSPPLAPTEAHRPPLVAVVPPPRQSSHSHGWHRTAPRSTAARCSSIPNQRTNQPVVSP